MLGQYYTIKCYKKEILEGPDSLRIIWVQMKKTAEINEADSSSPHHARLQRSSPPAATHKPR